MLRIRVVQCLCTQCEVELLHLYEVCLPEHSAFFAFVAYSDTAYSVSVFWPNLVAVFTEACVTGTIRLRCNSADVR